mmetsp:Transcript_59824/g.117576  ORF Transcript_59824/g.117576 Transcript_59824/m.117576 type:complete len:351 (-) Transcript_59824:105-1157(-)
MSTASVQDLVVNYLPEAVESTDLVLTHIKYSFLAGFAVFVILLPFCRSRKSFYDALAARQTVYFARLFIFTELLLVFCLYYFYFERGSPLKLHKYLPYGNGDNWLYSYGRPTAALIFIGVGMFGEIHPIVRIMCMLGCMEEVMSSSLSAYQVRDYYRQVKFFDAPRHGWSEKELLVYYWREIASLGVCTAAFLLIALLTIMMGFCEPQLIHPSLVSGNDLDRYAVMRGMKDQRKVMTKGGLLGPQKDNALVSVIKARQAAVLSMRNTVLKSGMNAANTATGTGTGSGTANGDAGIETPVAGMAGERGEGAASASDSGGTALRAGGSSRVDMGHNSSDVVGRMEEGIPRSR